MSLGGAYLLTEEALQHLCAAKDLVGSCRTSGWLNQDLHKALGAVIGPAQQVTDQTLKVHLAIEQQQ